MNDRIQFKEIFYHPWIVKYAKMYNIDIPNEVNYQVNETIFEKSDLYNPSFMEKTIIQDYDDEMPNKPNP